MAGDAKVEAAKIQTQNSIGTRIFYLGTIGAILGGLGYLTEIGVFNELGLGKLVEPDAITAAAFGGFAASNVGWAILGAVMHKHVELNGK